MRKLPMLLMALTLLGAGSLFADDAKKEQGTSTRARTTDGDVSYGRVKEFVAGDKVVIDVDNAIDKTFELDDKDLTVNMDTGLKVGDTVKVKEHSTAGKTTKVMISKHSGEGVAHGDKDPAAKKP
jgi:hypothetical protein